MDLSNWTSSKPFRFLVGPEKQEFPIHSALVAQQSPTLDALVNNGMKESRKCLVCLPDYEAETFACLVEFVYRGDFRSPGSVDFGEEYRSEDRATSGFPAPLPFGQSTVSKETWERFTDLPRYAYAGKQLYDTQLPYRADLGMETSSLLFLAKVYVLADYYGIDALMQLSLHKLHQLMISSNDTLDVIELARFRCDGHCPTRLSRLVLEYFAFHLYHTRHKPAYEELIAENPELLMEALDLFMLLMGGEGLDGEDEEQEQLDESESGTESDIESLSLILRA